MYFRQVTLVPESTEDLTGMGMHSGTAGQWQADFVPQAWQDDLISDGQPEPDLFTGHLLEYGLTNIDIEIIIADCE